MACNEEQMKRVIALHGPMVYQLAVAQLRNRTDADDIYQEVFLRYLRAEPTFADTEHQKAWFIRVTVNCCKDLLKRACRRDLPLTEREPAPEKEQEDLWEALYKLPEQQRLLIHLHYYEGYKAEEIGRILGMNPSTVRTGLKRARNKLKNILEGELF